jgi:hypothetical protein
MNHECLFGNNAGTVTNHLTHYRGYDDLRLLGLDAGSSGVSKGLLELMDPKGEGNIILRHVTNHSPKEAVITSRKAPAFISTGAKHHISRYPEVQLTPRGKQDRQRTYEARSRNPCYRRKTIGITYSVRVCLALVI